MVAETISYRHRNFILTLLAALAAIFFISFDLFISNATEAAVPSLQAFLGDVITSGTTAGSATVAAPIVVGGLADGAPYYYWGQKQTTQAQTKAQQKYCTANSSYPACSSQFQVIVIQCSSIYGCIGDPRTNPYWSPWISPWFQGIFQSIRISDDGSYLIVKTSVSDYTFADIGHANNGNVYTSVSVLDFNYQGSFQKWKDWPQDKQQAATNLLSDDDLNQILHSGMAGYLQRIAA